MHNFAVAGKTLSPFVATVFKVLHHIPGMYDLVQVIVTGDIGLTVADEDISG